MKVSFPDVSYSCPDASFRNEAYSCIIFSLSTRSVNSLKMFNHNIYPLYGIFTPEIRPPH